MADCLIITGAVGGPLVGCFCVVAGIACCQQHRRDRQRQNNGQQHAYGSTVTTPYQSQGHMEMQTMNPTVRRGRQMTTDHQTPPPRSISLANTLVARRSSSATAGRRPSLGASGPSSDRSSSRGPHAQPRQPAPTYQRRLST